MGKCELNGHIIRSEKDLKNYIAKIETGWGRPLHGTAKAFLFERMKGCFKQTHACNAVKHESIHVQQPLQLTDEEAMSGRSVVQILKDREKALERAWKRQRRQAVCIR